jgi:hypothetical protein
MKTAELTGAALDWTVAKCEGYEIVSMKGSKATFLDRRDDGALNDMEISYSTDWAQGGPIIEREKITIDYDHEGPTLLWEAKHFAFDGAVLQREYGPTPLIAAMRCYVASKMGDEVEIPKELL